MVRRFETTDIISFFSPLSIRLTAPSSVSCFVIRNERVEIFQQAKLPITESDLLVVELPDGAQPLLQICKALLQAELDIHYAYPILVGPHGFAALAFHVQDHETAVATLSKLGFTIFTETISKERMKDEG